MSNVHIPLEHQSAPKETPADKAIRLAAQEISDGKFVALEPEHGWNTGTEMLAQHPAVQDALSKLEYAVQKKTASEYLDKAQELHEVAQNAKAGNRWPGQERWLGKRMEEMRLVNPLSVWQFIEKLQKAGISAAREPKIKTELRADEGGVLQETEVEYSDTLLFLGRSIVRGYCGLFANQTRIDGTTETILAAKMQVPGSYEWDLLRFDEYGIPCGKRWEGWRTAVLQLVRKRIITEDQAIKAFGNPIQNEASDFYRQQMFELRHGIEG